jgi:enamine deaminase RidA (YjgF/YER057c/UK114 family)
MVLPPAAVPVGSYIAGTRVGNLVMVSGQIPMAAGKLTAVGKVGRDVSLDEAVRAARLCGLNALAVAADTAGGIDAIARVVRIAVYVNSAPGFTDQPKVANGASDLMVEVFGEAGKHVRAAVGANELPLDAAVEVELTVELRGDAP